MWGLPHTPLTPFLKKGGKNPEKLIQIKGEARDISHASVFCLAKNDR